VALAAQSSATVVILMGMHKLPQIIDLFQKEDKGDLPVAIIQNGTTSEEKVGVGTVNSILEIVKEKQLSSPAIIVLGEVVRESNKLKGFFEEFLSKEIVR
ncbi:MAG TPA: SAM-dependent methyltransferase, partial [Flavobacterium sp.]|nr:SAM-dependent methyltransferase [Flavobacterium sp.]